MTPEYIYEEYRVKGRSDADIARELGKEPRFISRLRKRFGIAGRSRAEAQSLALKQGRHPHPTRGKQRPAEVRERISEGVALWWERLPADEVAAHAAKARAQWDALSDAQKENFRRQAARAVQEAARTGSKLEKYLLAELTALGYRPEFHMQFFVNERLHVDLFLPIKGVCIEVDGPTHFMDVWGEDDLAKHIARDAQKTGLVLGMGFSLIRVKHTAKSVSLKDKRQLLQKVIAALQTIQTGQVVELELA